MDVHKVGSKTSYVGQRKAFVKRARGGTYKTKDSGAQVSTWVRRIRERKYKSVCKRVFVRVLVCVEDLWEPGIYRVEWSCKSYNVLKIALIENRCLMYSHVIWLCDWFGWVEILCELAMCDLLDVGVELCGVLLT